MTRHAYFRLIYTVYQQNKVDLGVSLTVRLHLEPVLSPLR